MRAIVGHNPEEIAGGRGDDAKEAKSIFRYKTLSVSAETYLPATYIQRVRKWALSWLIVLHKHSSLPLRCTPLGRSGRSYIYAGGYNPCLLRQVSASCWKVSNPPYSHKEHFTRWTFSHWSFRFYLKKIIVTIIKIILIISVLPSMPSSFFT